MIRRVAYVVDGFPKVTHTFIAGEIAEVRRRGIDVRILSLRPGDDETVHEIVTREGLLDVTCYDRDAFPRVVEELRPEIIHAHFARSATAAARDLSRAHGAPFAFTVHSYDLWRKPPPDLAERARAAASVVTVSELNADELAGRHGVDRAKLHVIPCGIDVREFRPGQEPAGPPRILAVARLHPVKNLPVLLRALAILRDGGVRFTCRVIGEGAERAMLEALRRELDLDDRVAFAGELTQSAVRDEWRRTTVGVLSSDTEGMPVALMEAAACGVPVAATRVGGIPELVVDGETGRLVPPRDPQALAAALRRLLDDAPGRRRMGQAARERAVRLLSVEHQVDALTGAWRSGIERALRAA